MKILYGVQGTGNGHITRARAMAAAFRSHGVHVDYLFSGRPKHNYFDMQEFGAWRSRPGLTFSSDNGKIDYFQTAFKNRYWTFAKDIWSLDLSPYDLVITDFEPISAWAGSVRGKTVISMGHQPAFDYPVPVAGADLRSRLVMKMFAPGNIRIGMHWDSFGAPLLPPMIDLTCSDVTTTPRKLLVYLPFEDQEIVRRVMAELREYECFAYAPNSECVSLGNVHLRPTSLAGFRSDLKDCSAVLCSAGFELASECMALGKQLLVKPVGRQMEQLSNALAIEQLGYGRWLKKLCPSLIAELLAEDRPFPKLNFPDVADALARWIVLGDYSESSLGNLSTALWSETSISQSNTLETAQSTSSWAGVSHHSHVLAG